MIIWILVSIAGVAWLVRFYAWRRRYRNGLGQIDRSTSHLAIIVGKSQTQRSWITKMIRLGPGMAVKESVVIGRSKQGRLICDMRLFIMIGLAISNSLSLFLSICTL